MKKEFGMMPCRECGADVKVMENEKGTLSYTCSARGCDDTGYATANSLKFASWIKKIKRFDGHEETAANTPSIAPPANDKKETKKANSVADVWGL